MIRTVLFTDIEASTSTTYRLGDEAAHRLTKAHNSIVRRAVRQHNGAEIKHTGDGIMASFEAASSAVDCAITIQKQLKLFARHDKNKLRVSIGINAGEPIAEDDDLFGTAVQIAARLCAQARGDEILISEVIKLLLAGKNYEFTQPRNLLLKGIEHPMAAYAVEWRQ